MSVKTHASAKKNRIRIGSLSFDVTLILILLLFCGVIL